MLPSFLLGLLAPLAHADEPASGALPAWVNAPPVTWTIALQTAGPLRATAEGAREPIARLVEALPAGDRVQIIAVHTRSAPVLPLRTVEDAGRAALAAEIRALELPSAKSTDLGAGLALVGARLDEAGGPGHHFVLMMGNFCHSPPLESQYADGGYGCRAIRRFDTLDETFDSSRGSGKLETILFPVGAPDAPVHEGGLQETRTFFEPSAVEVEATPFAAWVDATRANVDNVRLRPLARAEAAQLKLTARVTAQPTDERPTATVVLGTGLSHFGFTATQVVVEGARADAQTLTLSPEGTLSLQVDIPPAPFSVLPASDAVDLPVRVVVDGELSPPESIRALGIDPARSGLETSFVLHAERSYGLSPLRSFGIGASVLLLGSAGVLAARRRLTPLRLGGTFSYRRAGGARQTLDIAHLADAAIVVLPDGTLGVGRRDEALLVLRVERPLWKTHATAEIRAENAEINARPAAPGRHAVVPGATSFQFRDYRLSWE